MDVAVLMSTYNGEKYIRKQIDSILQQEGCDVSLLVRDDGSKDATLEILNEYQEQGLLRWYAGENLRSAKSFFHLLLNCGDYDYYAFSDQDDIWDQDKIICAVDALRQYNKPACYYCNSRLMDANDTMSQKLVYNDNKTKLGEKNSLISLLCTGGAMGCTMVMNRQFIDIVRQGGMPEKMIMHDCYLQALCKAVNGVVVFDGKPHMGYRQHSNNVIGRKTGIINALKYRFNFLREDRPVSIADHAREYLELYGNYINNEYKREIESVANYRTSPLNRIKLSLSNKLKFNSLKTDLFIRLSLLMDKR